MEGDCVNGSDTAADWIDKRGPTGKEELLYTAPTHRPIPTELAALAVRPWEETGSPTPIKPGKVRSLFFTLFHGGDEIRASLREWLDANVSPDGERFSIAVPSSEAAKAYLLGIDFAGNRIAMTEVPTQEARKVPCITQAVPTAS